MSDKGNNGHIAEENEEGFIFPDGTVDSHISSEQDRRRSMRRYFERKREQQDLLKELEDVFDDDDQ